MLKLFQVFFFICYISFVLSSCNVNTTLILEYLEDGYMQLQKSTTVKFISTKPHLNFIKVSNGDIDVLCTEFLKYMKDVDKLTISASGITAIEKDAFKDLRQLNSLRIENNFFQEVQHGIFNGLNITVLSLKNNGISYIARTAFDDMPYLSILVLNQNKLYKIEPRWFARKSMLEEIFLVNNQIEEIQADAFKYLERGHNCIVNQVERTDEQICPSIFLSLNKISTIDENAFRGIKAYDKIILDKNYLQDLPHLPENILVYCMSVEHNDLTYISEETAQVYLKQVNQTYLLGNLFTNKTINYLIKINEDPNVLFMYTSIRNAYLT